MSTTAEHAARQRLTIGLVALIAVPGLSLRFEAFHANHAMEALLFGLAVVSAAFMLAWAAEVIQLDISAGLALALLALIAVLPEYAVDFVFTWDAGDTFERLGNCGDVDAENNPCSLALANMTGANQLLIGLGWSAVVLVAAWRIKRLHGEGQLDRLHGGTGKVFYLERTHAVEIAFLAIATVYGLTLPLRHTLGLIDAAVLVTIFGLYVVRIARAPAEEPHLVGPASYIGAFTVARRRAAVAVLFVIAAGIILACAEHFAEALVETGTEYGVSEFLLVKWLAPLASEAPEFIVALLFAWRLNTNSALGALVSSKVNQWTLLVGTLPIVFAISSASSHGLPLNTIQREELFVTAAQSVFAVAVLASRSISVREAQTLLGIFVVQFVLQGVLTGDAEQVSRIGVGIFYLLIGAFVIAQERRTIPHLMRDGFRTPYSELAAEEPQLAHS
jgi:cation:H+ antiporter